MIKIYKTGQEFYDENKSFLLENLHQEVFFRIDAPLLTSTNHEEFALCVYDGNKKLLVLNKEPYNTLYFGDKTLVKELIKFYIENNYKIKDFLCETELGKEFVKEYLNIGIKFEDAIDMDLMECRNAYPIDSSNVEKCTENDLEELASIEGKFIIECGLKDEINKENIKKTIDGHRVIREKGKIVAVAKRAEANPEFIRIAFVYTDPKYRGRGYAKTLCATLLNEALSEGRYATLNVDQKNPISNHVYASIGFRKLFSQSEFYKID